MDKKKIVTRQKKVNENNLDGIDNSEHILDLTREIDLLYGNIKDNTDICIDIFKYKKEEKVEEDILDAIQISCEKIIEIEKLASELNKYQSTIDAKDEVTLKGIYANMKDLEDNSKKLIESIDRKSTRLNSSHM